MAILWHRKWRARVRKKKRKIFSLVGGEKLYACVISEWSYLEKTENMEIIQTLTSRILFAVRCERAKNNFFLIEIFGVFRISRHIDRSIFQNFGQIFWLVYARIIFTSFGKLMKIFIRILFRIFQIFYGFITFFWMKLEFSLTIFKQNFSIFFFK